MESFINCIDSIIKLPNDLDGWCLDQAVREIYDTAYGIYDHSAEASPSNLIPLATIKPMEQVNADPYIKREIRELLRLNAPKRTGMSIVELLDMDAFEYGILKDALIEDSMRESSMVSDILDDD